MRDAQRSAELLVCTLDDGEELLAHREEGLEVGLVGVVHVLREEDVEGIQKPEHLRQPPLKVVAVKVNLHGLLRRHQLLQMVHEAGQRPRHSWPTRLRRHL